MAILTETSMQGRRANCDVSKQQATRVLIAVCSVSRHVSCCSTIHCRVSRRSVIHFTSPKCTLSFYITAQKNGFENPFDSFI